MMRTEISKGPNEMPIVCITIVLGLLSYMATFYVMVFQGGSLPFTYMAGIFCGLCALLLGLKISSVNWIILSYWTGN